MFACDVSTHGVIAGEGARTEGTMHADALMTLTDVGAQVCLIAIQAITEQALQLLA